MLVARIDLEGVPSNEVEINVFLHISRMVPFKTILELSMAMGDIFGVTATLLSDTPRSFVFESSVCIGFEDTHECKVGSCE